MFEFKGIDLSTKYIKPSTWDWIVHQIGDDDYDAAIEAVIYDDGHGVLIWTYSVDEEDWRLPQDLRDIIIEAYDHGWRFIVLDSDGEDCELFPSYEEEWPA